MVVTWTCSEQMMQDNIKNPDVFAKFETLTSDPFTTNSCTISKSLRINLYWSKGYNESLSCLQCEASSLPKVKFSSVFISAIKNSSPVSICERSIGFVDYGNVPSNVLTEPD